MTVKEMVSTISEYCSADVEEIFQHSLHNQETRFIMRQDPANTVLAVCHADTVYTTRENTPFRKDGTLHSPALDDRVGVALVDAILPTLGIGVDVLITDNEEIGGSTAEYVSPQALKKYNWIVELDRRGDDAVTYNLDSPKWLDVLKGVGFKIGRGAFSDICSLDTDVCCVNIGVGYHLEHSPKCYLEIGELVEQLKRLKRLVDQHGNKRYTQTPRYSYGYTTKRTGGNVVDLWPELEDNGQEVIDIVDETEIYETELRCYECSAPISEDEELNQFGLCKECFSSQLAEMGVE